ncbi:hypothetical protein BDV93DRAFT_526107, partial [Ceratobasidium sp. AG-I]
MVNVRAADLCPVYGYDDIDLSASAFEKLADTVSWKFIQTVPYTRREAGDGKWIGKNV